MFVTVHVAAGAAMASVIPNPLISLPAAFASHFVLDAIPHWHDTVIPEKATKKTYMLSTADFVIAVILTLYYLSTLAEPNLVWIILASTIMDTDVLLYPWCKKFGWRNPWPSFVSKIHGGIQNETKSLWGLFPQLVIIAISLFVVLGRIS